MMDRGGYNPLWRSKTEDATTYDRYGRYPEGPDASVEDEERPRPSTRKHEDPSIHHPDDMYGGFGDVNMSALFATARAGHQETTIQFEADVEKMKRDLVKG